jgi:hypothetical protein
MFECTEYSLINRWIAGCLANHPPDWKREGLPKQFIYLGPRSAAILGRERFSTYDRPALLVETIHHDRDMLELRGLQP